MQSANKVTIINKGSRPIVDEIVEDFARYVIYSIKDLYCGYDQFRLASKNRDLTTMKTPLELMKMCFFCQGATNSVAHMQNAMNRITWEIVLEKTIPFVNNIPIKGCKKEVTNSKLDADGCKRFVKDHIEDVEFFLERLGEVHLILPIDRSTFRIDEILVYGHLCGNMEENPILIRLMLLPR